MRSSTERPRKTKSLRIYALVQNGLRVAVVHTVIMWYPFPWKSMRFLEVQWFLSSLWVWIGQVHQAVLVFDAWAWHLKGWQTVWVPGSWRSPLLLQPYWLLLWPLQIHRMRQELPLNMWLELPVGCKKVAIRWHHHLRLLHHFCGGELTCGFAGQISLAYASFYHAAHAQAEDKAGTCVNEVKCFAFLNAFAHPW